MEHLDGNAAAGELSEVFALDVTTAVATCAGCGTTGPVAQAMVYEAGMGTVLRCPACDTRAAALRARRGTSCGWRCAASARAWPLAKRPVDDAAGVALEDLSAVGGVARRAARRPAA